MELKKFIKENNLSFEEGQRNTNAVILCGYALHINKTAKDCKESVKEYSSEELDDEIDRVYFYASTNGYGIWLKTLNAKKMYKF